MNDMLAIGAIASPIPNNNRNPKTSSKLRAHPVAAEAKHQTKNAPAYSFRIPNRSSSAPPGT